MTTTNLGKVSVTPKGEYDPLVTYERLDIISHNGSGYIVKQASTGVTPIEGEFYALIAEKGDGGSFVKKAYKTYAAMDADKVNIPANSSVDVTNDLDESKNGAYIYDGVAFTRSQYDSKVVTDKIIADTAVAVQDAINNTAVEGGVLADTFVTATANGVGAVARNQRDKNSDTVSVKDFGGENDGDITDALNSAKDSTNSFILNTKNAIAKQVSFPGDHSIYGRGASLKQIDVNKHILTSGVAAGTDMGISLSVFGVSFSEMPDAISDDYAALRFSSTNNSISAFNRFYDIENAITSAGTSPEWLVEGKGAKDTLSIGDYVEGNKRFCFQNIQSSYTRIVAMAANHKGDSDQPWLNEPYDSNNGGRKGGIRLAGLGKGNIVSACNIRDTVSAISHQTGCYYNVVTGNYYENQTTSAVATTSGTQGNSYGNVHTGFVALNTGGTSLSINNQVFSRFNGLVSGFGKRPEVVGVYGNLGFDARTGTKISKKYYQIRFKDGSGIVPSIGDTISQGSANGKLAKIQGINLKTLTQGEALPSEGLLLLEDITGDYFNTDQPLTGINATVNEAMPADGAHRIDLSTYNTGSGLHGIIGTDSNLVDLITMSAEDRSLSISGSYNNVRINVSSSPSSSSKKITVSGNYNIIEITDDSLSVVNTLEVSGNNNIIIVTAKEGAVYVTGTDNSIKLNVSKLTAGGNGNLFTGHVRSLSRVGSSINDFSGLYNAREIKKITSTTTSLGGINVSHDLAGAPQNVVATIEGDKPYFVVVKSRVTTANSITLIVYNFDGTPVSGEQITISVRMEI